MHVSTATETFRVELHITVSYPARSISIPCTTSRYFNRIIEFSPIVAASKQSIRKHFTCSRDDGNCPIASGRCRTQTTSVAKHRATVNSRSVEAGRAATVADLSLIDELAEAYANRF